MNKIIPLLFTLLLGCAQFGSPSTSDPKLIGHWECISATIDGKPLPPETVKLLRLTITQTRYTTDKGNETLFDSTYRVNRAKKPAQIFMLGNEGALTGKEAHGIYEISTETLHICYTLPGDPPATDFTSALGSKRTLVLWRRADLR